MKKIRLTQALWARIMAFFLLVLMTAGILLCGLTMILAVEDNWYFREPDFYESWFCRENAYQDISFTQAYYNANSDVWQDYLEDFDGGNYSFVVRDETDGVLADTRGNTQTRKVIQDYCFERGLYEETESGETREYYTLIDAYIASPLQPVDEYYVLEQVFHFLYSARYTAIILGLTMIVVSFALFVFLMCSAGHKPGTDAPVLIRQDKIPFDLYVTLLITMGAIWGAAASEAFYRSVFIQIAVIVVSILFYAILVYTFCMTLAARLKVGKWWRNTLIYRFFRLLFRMTARIIRGISLTWRVVLGYCAFALLNVIVLALLFSEGSFLGFLAFVTLDLGMLAFLCIVVIQMKTLQKGGEALANGDLDHKVNTTNLYYDFKRHGENLNRINEGIAKAVNERMKSERFKTELITNVSHDIKTPLTSIINYIDLLKKEPIEGTKAAEYIEVLERQSAKLKKLTEDIIEASKASAGVIAVNAERTNVVELLNQSLGEYGERLEKSQITAVVSAPEQGAYIDADGRLLWRVFDNILQNICKYALPGTRAYFDISVRQETVEITSKNISASELNISADALMERFIRGDSSRGSEGSGLGISIAKSLTELQHGVFDIQLDGDLFKVILRFPVYQERSALEAAAAEELPGQIALPASHER